MHFFTHTVPHCSTVQLFHTVPLFHHIVTHCSTVPPHSSTVLPYCSTLFDHSFPFCFTVPPHCSTLFHTIIPDYFLPWRFASSASNSCEGEFCYELITVDLRDYSMRTNLLELPNGSRVFWVVYETNWSNNLGSKNMILFFAKPLPA